MSSSDSDSSSDDETFVPNDVHDSSDENNESAGEQEDASSMKKEDVDDLWESFKKDTATTKSVGGTNSLKKEHLNEPSTIKVTKVYDFAGEEVKVTEEVAKDKVAKTTLPNHGQVKMKRLGGLQGALGKLSKKPKLSTLEKSKLDWNTFKDEEGIAEDLKFHNKGKNGFVEKKMFLERTDNRQFEKERDMRLSKSSKR